jgi:hypothetical protein
LVTYLRGRVVTTTNTPETTAMNDQQRLRVAEEKYRQIKSKASELRPLQLAELISRETGVGSDAARLVVMAHHKV